MITYVLGREKTSIAKKIAKFPIIGDASNSELVKKIIKENKIDSLLVGTVDVLLKVYYQVCKDLNFPSFANKKSIDAFSDKLKFNKICKKFGFKQIPDYTKLLMRNNSLPEKLFPVLMKPIDSGGGVGARICYNNLQVKKAIKEILNISKQKKYLCQKIFFK